MELPDTLKDQFVIQLMFLIANQNSEEHIGLVSRQLTFQAAQVTQLVLPTS